MSFCTLPSDEFFFCVALDDHVPAVNGVQMLTDEMVNAVLKAVAVVSHFIVLFVHLSIMSNLFHIWHSNLICAVYNWGNLILHDLGLIQLSQKTFCAKQIITLCDSSIPEIITGNWSRVKTQSNTLWTICQHGKLMDFTTPFTHHLRSDRQNYESMRNFN